MIDGVTVLNTFSAEDRIVILVLEIIFILALMFHLYLIVLSRKEKDIFFAVFVGIVAILYMLIAIVLNYSYVNWDEKEHRRYEVTIDENVSFKDFYNKYEVIKTEGEIYTIKIKDEGYLK